MLDAFDRFPSTTALMLASGAFLMSATARAEAPHPSPKMQPASQVRTIRTIAATRAPVPRVELEMRDVHPGRATSIERVSVSLGDRGASKLDSWMRGGRYKVQIGRDGHENPDTFNIELRRDPRSTDSNDMAEISTSATVRLKPGQRVVIARIERSNGSRTEVTATIR